MGNRDQFNAAFPEDLGPKRLKNVDAGYLLVCMRECEDGEAIRRHCSVEEFLH